MPYKPFNCFRPIQEHTYGKNNMIPDTQQNHFARQENKAYKVRQKLQDKNIKKNGKSAGSYLS